jgi:hypothetical protein
MALSLPTLGSAVLFFNLESSKPSFELVQYSFLDIDNDWDWAAVSTQFGEEKLGE